MERKKLLVGTGVVSFCLAAGVVGVLAGCAAGQQAGSPGSGEAPAPAAETEATRTMEEWGELYPLQFGSYAEGSIKEGKTDDEGNHEGHYDLKAKMLAPAVRVERPDGQRDTKLVNPYGTFNEDYIIVEGVDYDPETGRWYVKDGDLRNLTDTRERKGCYACKSTNFDDVYEREGAEIFTEKLDDEFIQEMNGQIWNCTTCHDGDPAQNAPDAQLTYWTQLSRESFDKLDPKDRACGQCHNSFDYRSHITDQETMDSFSPYRYGFDVDSLYDAAIEDGVYSVDEDTGIVLSCFDHPDVELLQGSVHSDLGMTCVDCHMPTMTDSESGQEFTYHNASESPLENETALEYCLTCHKSQGIESTDAMKKMVKDRQAEIRDAVADYPDKFTAAYDAIKAAKDSGSVSEDVLQKARDDYSKAEAYYHVAQGGSVDGVKVAHNPEALPAYYTQAGTLLDGVIASLA